MSNVDKCLVLERPGVGAVSGVPVVCCRYSMDNDARSRVGLFCARGYDAAAQSALFSRTVSRVGPRSLPLAVARRRRGDDCRRAAGVRVTCDERDMCDMLHSITCTCTCLDQCDSDRTSTENPVSFVSLVYGMLIGARTGTSTLK